MTSLISSLVSIAAAFVVYVLWWLFHPYVKEGPMDNLLGPPPTSWLMGNIPDLKPRSSWKYWIHLAETYGPVSTITGMLGKKVMVVHDPKAMHAVLIKDIEFYPKELSPSDIFTALIGPGLLTARGQQHRRQRKQLNPVFSIAHLRNMTHIFYRVVRQVRGAIKTRLPADSMEDVVDINAWMARTTLEMLGQAGLGYSFDNFIEDSTDAFGESCKRFFPQINRAHIVFGMALQHLSYIIPDRFIVGFFRLFPLKGTQELIRMADMLKKRSKEIVDEKRRALLKGDDVLIHEIGEGKDIMSICLKANMAASDAEKLNDAELIAQMSTFIVAGMDTTSNALSRIIHLLAQNPVVQQKLRAEIVEARGGPGGDSDLPYDDLMKLPYLDAVCRETLRVHAPVILVGRKASKDMVLPISAPIRGKDGSMLHEVVVSKGTPVLMHIQACNRNPELWGEDADEWKPERCIRENPI